MENNDLSKPLLMFGFTCIALGLLISGHFGSFGKLPGDILIKKSNFSLYIPLTSMMLLSLMLTFVVSVFQRIIRH